MLADLCQAYVEPGGGFLGHRCGRLATHDVVLENGRQGRLCDLCWAKVQDQARKHTVRLMQHERFTEPSLVYAPYVPLSGNRKGDTRWQVIIVRDTGGSGSEYLAEDRHDDRNAPFWTGDPKNPFILRFWNLDEAGPVAVAYPGARLECVLVE
jgi:hypothetical protein